VGYAATGEVSEEVFVILHGVGANGKSTLVNAIMEALEELRSYLGKRVA
jgi:phage/plasmid-associated DNA primase